MIESIIKWSMIGLMALGALNAIAAIGKPRGPITHRMAVTITVMQAAWITAILVFWD